MFFPLAARDEHPRLFPASPEPGSRFLFLFQNGNNDQGRIELNNTFGTVSATTQNVGRSIARAREAMHMSPDDLAKRLGTTITTLAQWENDPHGAGMEDMRKIARFTGISVYSLFGVGMVPTQP
jgi:DNA-binding transcriptional regulator YiaG